MNLSTAFGSDQEVDKKQRKPSQQKLASTSAANQCVICGAQSLGHHFGILSCRACAAFFRRTVVENKVYKCRQNEQCQIKKEMRNMCRACRFASCVRLGMNKNDVQLNRDPIGKRYERMDSQPMECSTSSFSPSRLQMSEDQKSSTLTSLTSNQQTIGSPFSIKSDPKPVSLTAGVGTMGVLAKMQEGYRMYQSSQKTLFAMMYPDSIFSLAADQYRLIKHSEYVQMERACLPIMLSMLNESFPPFDTFDQQTKITILKGFNAKFTLMNNDYQTTKVFPYSETESRYCLHYGQYVDKNNMEHFFSETPDPKYAAKNFQKLGKELERAVVRMHTLDVREIEIVALIGIILWNEVCHLGIDGADKALNLVFAELHNDIIVNYGIPKAGVRFGSLLNLVHDIMAKEREIFEQVAMAKIFNPHLMEVWE